MKNKIIYFFKLLFLLAILSACSTSSLKKTKETFEINRNNYSFQLPKGWHKATKTLNEEALFEAEDTNSRSVMFIRAQPSEQLDEQELTKKVDNQLSPIYQLELAEVEKLKINEYDTIHYTIPSVYDEKAVWLDMYFVSTETNIINFQFYYPKDNSKSKQKEKFLLSVQTLNLNAIGTKAEASNKSDLNKIQQVENNQVFLQVTENKLEEETLVLRYVITNKSDQSVVPKDQWEQLVTVTEDNANLAITDQPNSDSELNYLVGKGDQQVKPGESVECAIIYKLPTTKSTIQVELDNNGNPLVMNIER